MELPEQDKQALIEAARRRTQPQQGGAAFGVYPSSGKRPEKLNVSRDVNMPAQAARGWVAGTLGLPGDIESLGRMAVNFAFGPGGVNVDETPVLPTSEFYQEWLPGRDERPAAKFASGLGALAGGAGSTKLAGAAVKGAQATGKALGPKAAEMAESYLQKSGLAPSVIKPKGGNWLSGSVEKATEPLKFGQEGMYYRLTPEERLDPDFAPVVEIGKRNQAVDEWIDTKLNKYIRNEMGTPEDPVRRLAERDVLHVDPEQLNFRPEMHGRYLAEGQTAVAQSPTAKTWEGAADLMIAPAKAGELLSKDTWLADLPQYQKPLEDNPWLAKVSPETSVYALSTEGGRPTVGRDLGFDHLIDELRNATRADSDLPANLRWKPEDLKKVTMEQAVERVAKINEYRAAKKAEANEVLARNPATAPYKDYETVPGTQEPNSKGLAWKQIKAPESLPEGWQEAKPNEFGTPRFQRTGSEKIIGRDPRAKALEEALKYEGDVMGHCVGGYCDDVLSGRSQIYSLRDKKGEPHVTIEVNNTRRELSEREVPLEVTTQLKESATKRAREVGEREGLSPYSDEVALLESELYHEDLYNWRINNPIVGNEIIQIKGKGNAAPKAEYLPFVQDFVRSGNWSRVGDFKNTGMRDMSNTPNLQKWLESKNIPHSRYVTEQEYAKYEADFLADRLNREGFPGFAKGGLVQDTDAIAAKLTGMDKDKALTHALRMANAKQEAHMAAGGLAKLLKGAKKAEEATKAAKATEKAAEVAKPAVKGPQAEALETARKNAVKMLGLPENNKAMDRAKALGFVDEGLLHGTVNDFPAFKVSDRSNVYATDAPAIADIYANATGRHKALREINAGPNVMPLMYRGKLLEVSDQGPTGGGWLSDNLAAALGTERRRNLVKDVPAKGYSGIKVTDMDDLGGRQSQYVFPDPTVLRSRFAAFDPARVNENDLLGAADPALLAGTAVASGIGLGALVQAKKRKPEQPEQKKAAGGLAKLIKGAKAAEEAAAATKAAKPVAPVIMPPVPPMTKEQMRPIAQRVASQMTGEFVRPNPKLSINPAGKSQKVFQREQDLPVEIVQKIPQKPAQPVDIEKYEGYGLVGVPGDPTIGGVAKPGSLSQIHEGAAELRKLGDVEFQHPVQLFGGPRYGAYNPGEEFWASNIGPARTLQNRITATSEALDAPVLGQYIKMSPESTNFALHNLDALLSYMEPEKLSKSKLQELNEEIRKGSPKLGQFPGFAGFEDPIDVLLQSQIHSDLRKHIAETLMKPTVAKKYGLRPGSDVLFGISKPELRELEAGISGYSVGQMKPGAELTPSLHPTYDYDIPGTFIGQSKYPTPYEIAFPASTAYTRSQLKPGVQEFNMLKMVGPREKIDPQYIDQIKMYEELMKEYTGKKKGGLVKKSGLSVLNKAII